MFNINLPASDYLVSQTATEVREIYTIISQIEDEVTIRVNTNPLEKGKTLIFNQEIVGVVTNVVNNIAFVRLSQNAKVQDVEEFKWVEPTPKVLIFKDVGSLNVRCTNTGTDKPGLIGWTLRDANRTILAVGSDINKKHHCTLEGNSLWAPGRYELEVMNFTKNKQPLGRFGRMSWTIEPGMSIAELNGSNSNTKVGQYIVMG